MIPGDKYHRQQARYVWLFVGAFVACIVLASVISCVATVAGAR
jgi:hypothetical protein